MGNSTSSDGADRRLCGAAEVYGAQAVSARPHARTLVPLQSRLRRLRQDRLSRQDSQSALARSPNASARSMNAARRSWSSPAASRCCTRNCRRSSKARSRAGNTSPSAPMRCCSRRSSISTSRTAIQLVDPSRRRQGDARSFGLPAGRLRSGRRGDEARPRARLPRHHQLHAVQRCPARPRRGLLRHVKHMGIDGITVSPGYAYERAPDQQHFLNREQDQESVPRYFRARPGRQGVAVFQSQLFLDFLAGNQTYHCTPWGNPDAHRLRLAAALLSARRGLCEDLQGADGRDRLGHLRHRQL